MSKKKILKLRVNWRVTSTKAQVYDLLIALYKIKDTRDDLVRL